MEAEGAGDRRGAVPLAALVHQCVAAPRAAAAPAEVSLRIPGRPRLFLLALRPPPVFLGDAVSDAGRGLGRRRDRVRRNPRTPDLAARLRRDTVRLSARRNR